MGGGIDGLKLRGGFLGYTLLIITPFAISSAKAQDCVLLLPFWHIGMEEFSVPIIVFKLMSFRPLPH